MWSLALGSLSLLLFFVPLLCPTLALLSIGCAIGPFRRKRRRKFAVVGIVCSAVAVVLQQWVWRFGHFP
ncbi:MAG: hypothetical protein JSU68_07915 [Phycisphaerales bacterium]|nr:MAG: hypothetical protein JSU68_07915 [Phycisphaerales bacterium]